MPRHRDAHGGQARAVRERHCGLLDSAGRDRTAALQRCTGHTNPINVTTGLPPLIARIVSTNALDTNPLAGPSYYAVTAVDAVGNESPPSASAYTNISLLPVNSLRVDQNDGALARGVLDSRRCRQYLGLQHLPRRGRAGTADQWRVASEQRNNLHRHRL